MLGRDVGDALVVGRIFELDLRVLQIGGPFLFELSNKRWEQQRDDPQGAITPPES